MRRQPQGGGAPVAADPANRSIDLRLAALHLRTGSYAIARAELETQAGADTLDEDGLLDLAEIRWRTGDLPGAGEAAAAYLASGRESVLGFVIAAEATAALGRPGEARRLAGRALDTADGPLEPLFAGLPRSPIWPHDPGDPGEPAGMLFGGADAGAAMGFADTPVEPDGHGGHGARARVAAEALPTSLWEAHPHAAIPAPALPDGRLELDAARDALAAGDIAVAGMRLSVVLRVSPVLAPAVLEVAGSTRGAAFDLIRGDAYRLVGHEAEAQRAYASVAATFGDDAGASTEDAALPTDTSGESSAETSVETS
jgi:hypothetical protein